MIIFIEGKNEITRSLPRSSYARDSRGPCIQERKFPVSRYLAYFADLKYLSVLCVLRGLTTSKRVSCALKFFYSYSSIPLCPPLAKRVD